MSFSNNPFGVLDADQQDQDWNVVETRRQRARRTKKGGSAFASSNFSERSKKGRGNSDQNLSQAFTDLMLKEYSGSFQVSNIRKVCEMLLADLDLDMLKVREVQDSLRKRVVERVGMLEQEALFSTLSGSIREKEDEDEEEEDDLHRSAVKSEEDTQDSEEVAPMEKEKEEDLHTPNTKKPDEISKEKSATEEEVEEDVEDNKSEYEEESVHEEPMVEVEEVFREPTPEEKTLPQLLAEQAKAFDITTMSGLKLLEEWACNIEQGGEAGREYRASFNQSIILRTIIRTLLTVSPNADISGAEETIQLFHLILQGNHEYHGWLYKQIRKLADFISKTAKREDSKWVKFLCNQAFALVDAQKEQDRRIEDAVHRTLLYTLPSTHMITDHDNRLKLQSEQSDSLCRNVFAALQDLQAKDDELMAMNPTASIDFKERYTQIQSHLNEYISKAQAHVTAQARQLEKINEKFKANERRTKELIQPIEEQLREILQSSDQTKNEIRDYEARLKAAREKLAELDNSKNLLTARITKIKAAHHPQKADFVKQRANSQFKLHSASREHNCYIHVQHIAAESYKHLESWSQCTIIQERESRRILLQRFYDAVEKYVCTLFAILHLLGQRVRFMKQSLERNRTECDRRKQLFGRSHSTMDMCIAADKEKMDLDLTMIDKLQMEVDGIIQKSFSAATKWGVYEQIFNDLWHKIRSMASQYKVDLNSFVKLKVDPAMAASMTNNTRHNAEQAYSQHHATSPPVRDQVQTNQGYNTGGHQTMQPLISDLQESQYEKSVPEQGSGQLPPHRSQKVPQTHAQGASNQQPLKIINNATNKKYDLQQQKTRDLYQNQPYQNHVQPAVQGRPMRKDYQTTPAKPPTQESNIQFNKRRAGRSTTPWGRHYSQ
jgi:hypothetical protein